MRATTLLVAALVTVGSTAAGESLVQPRVDDWVPVAAPPSTSTTRISIGRPSQRATIERVWIRYAHDTTRVVATVMLELVGPDDKARDVTVPITVPSGARANGLALVGNAGSHRVATTRAVEAYEHTVETIKVDPALLALHSRSPTGDRLHLRAFPVSSWSRMRVELAIELPHARFAQLDLGAQPVTALAITTNDDHKEWKQAKGMLTVELFPPQEPHPGRPSVSRLPPDEPGVDEQYSLVAGAAELEHVPPPPVAIPPKARPAAFVRIAPPEVSLCNFGGDRRIRAHVRRHQAQLRRCYMLVAQRDPTIAGTLMLRFRIERDGRVTDTAVSGVLPAQVRSCVRKEVASWQFPPDDASIRVTYPLTFRLTNPPAPE